MIEVDRADYSRAKLDHDRMVPITIWDLVSYQFRSYTYLVTHNLEGAGNKGFRKPSTLDAKPTKCDPLSSSNHSHQNSQEPENPEEKDNPGTNV